MYVLFLRRCVDLKINTKPQWVRVHPGGMGRLSGRLREQARSHKGIGYILKSQAISNDADMN